METFLAQAKKGNTAQWLLLLGAIVVMLGYFLGQLPFIGTIYTIGAQQGLGNDVLLKAAETLDLTELGIHKNVTLLLLLLMFVFGMMALWVVVTRMHRRPWKSLFTARTSVNYGRAFRFFLMFMGLQLIGEAIFYAMDNSNYVWQFQLWPFLGMCLVVLPLIPIQTSFEELFFRGYLMQGIALISKYPWIPMVITSLMFGLMHGMNPEVEKFGFYKMMTYYIGVGLFLAVITVMDESLEPALGIHAAVNMYGVLFVNFEGSALQTYSVLQMKTVNSDNMIFSSFIFLSIVLFVLTKTQGWKDWGKLFRPIS